MNTGEKVNKNRFKALNAEVLRIKLFKLLNTNVCFFSRISRLISIVLSAATETGGTLNSSGLPRDGGLGPAVPAVAPTVCGRICSAAVFTAPRQTNRRVGHVTSANCYNL